MRYVLYIGLEIVIGLCCKNSQCYIHILIFSLIFLGNYSFEFSYQVLNPRYFTFKCKLTIELNNFSFVFYIGILIGRECEKVQLIFVFVIFKLIILQSYSNGSSRRGLRRDVFGNNGFRKIVLLYVRSIFFCVPLTEKIAVRLCFLFMNFNKRYGEIRGE